MRKSYILLLLVLFSLPGLQCRKHKIIDALSQLPPETQTGTNTFGCLVNGQVFVPKGPSLSPILSSYYQHIYPVPDGFVFQVSADDNSHNANFFSVTILVDSMKLYQPQSIVLKTKGHGRGAGQYYSAIFNGTTGITSTSIYSTSDLVNGMLTIKKFDEINQIASGTFWFNAVNSLGDTVKITDGRFDMHFTR